jgi:hypothetical protein
MSHITKTAWVISIFNICCCLFFFWFKYMVFEGYMRISTSGEIDRHKIVKSVAFNPNIDTWKSELEFWGNFKDFCIWFLNFFRDWLSFHFWGLWIHVGNFFQRFTASWSQHGSGKGKKCKKSIRNIF